MCHLAQSRRSHEYCYFPAIGTFETCRRTLRMSVRRGSPGGRLLRSCSSGFDPITGRWALAMASMTVVLRRAALLNQVRPFSRNTPRREVIHHYQSRNQSCLGSRLPLRQASFLRLLPAADRSPRSCTRRPHAPLCQRNGARQRFARRNRPLSRATCSRGPPAGYDRLSAWQPLLRDRPAFRRCVEAV